VDFLGAAGGIAAVLAGSSLLFRDKNKTTNKQ